MNTQLRSKRVIIPSIAAIAVLGVGGTVWAASASDSVEGSDRDRVAAAAERAAGGGTATEVETSDDKGEAYEVEVRMQDGTEIDIALDDDLAVVSKHEDDRDDDRDDDGRADDRDRDDRTLDARERAAAAKAAEAAVGGGTAVDVEASDDRGQAYEAEVLDAEKQVWDVDLDADFRVLSKKLDD